MVTRQVRYNIRTDTGEQISQRHRWTIAIINQPREIERIKQRFLENLAPAGDFSFHTKTLIPNSRGLYFEAFSFSSNLGKIEDKEKIYKSNFFYKDRNLFENRNDISWERYLKSLS
jgi:hypothetical protein